MNARKQPEKRCRNNKAILHFAEERMKLLDTIKEMVETEVDRQMKKVYRTKQIEINEETEEKIDSTKKETVSVIKYIDGKYENRY